MHHYRSWCEVIFNSETLTRLTRFVAIFLSTSSCEDNLWMMRIMRVGKRTFPCLSTSDRQRKHLSWIISLSDYWHQLRLQMWPITTDQSRDFRQISWNQNGWFSYLVRRSVKIRETDREKIFFVRLTHRPRRRHRERKSRFCRFAEAKERQEEKRSNSDDEHNSIDLSTDKTVDQFAVYDWHWSCWEWLDRMGLV